MQIPLQILAMYKTLQDNISKLIKKD